ncbi:hypothetical protein [Caballeronia sordidicola]|uniref:hypothetical protein n=1 Tax=Caballeronia sordidicola TaxID=196367 RepID=UPI004037F39B
MRGNATDEAEAQEMRSAIDEINVRSLSQALRRVRTVRAWSVYLLIELIETIDLVERRRAELGKYC